jgi:hypothetical protein
MELRVFLLKIFPSVRGLRFYAPDCVQNVPELAEHALTG